MTKMMNENHYMVLQIRARRSIQGPGCKGRLSDGRSKWSDENVNIAILQVVVVVRSVAQMVAQIA